MEDNQIFVDYTVGLAKAARNLPRDRILEAAKIIFDAISKGNKIILFGNGGSASTASHISADLHKNAGKYIFTHCLSDNVAALTAYANDHDYEECYERQLIPILHKGDIVVAISTSGESKNIIYAVESIPSEYTLIGLIGNNKGSLLSKWSDIPIHVESDNIGIVEDLHLAIGHIWTELIRSW